MLTVSELETANHPKQEAERTGQNAPVNIRIDNVKGPTPNVRKLRPVAISSEREIAHAIGAVLCMSVMRLCCCTVSSDWNRF
jgi:hypothetical protein